MYERHGLQDVSLSLETRISKNSPGVPWELRVSQLSNLDPRRVVPDFFPHQGIVVSKLGSGLLGWLTVRASGFSGAT